MAKDEGLLHRAAEFRAVNDAFNGDTRAIEERWGYERFREARRSPWLQHWRAALDAAAGDYWEHLHGLRRGDVESLEPALVFLETHPRFHRSGYLAQALMEALLRRPELRLDTTRLQDIALGILDDGSSRELRSAANLASEVWSPEFEAALDARLQTARDRDDHAQRRAIEFFRGQALARQSSRRPRRAARQTPKSSVRLRESRRARRIRQVSRALEWALTDYNINEGMVADSEFWSIATSWVDVVISGADDDTLIQYLIDNAVRLGTPRSGELRENVELFFVESVGRIRSDVGI
jgi:hypothetical protein